MSDNVEIGTHDNPGVIAPPPIIFFGVWLLAYLMHLGVNGPGFGFPDMFRWFIGADLVLGGIVIASWAARLFQIAKTSIKPWNPSTNIVTDGVYRFTRNPMYLAMVLVYIGGALLVDSIVILLALPLVLAVMHYGVILREERYLEAKFGTVYLDYKKHVRRWI